ncbi:MAG: tol-pal system YbgF family protein [Saprospiraceae bacterium]
MNKEPYLKRIEAYFEEQMSVEEKTTFESELKSSPELLEATEKYKISRQAIDLLSEDALRSKFKDWRKKKEDIVTINEGLEKTVAVPKPATKVRSMWNSSIKKMAIVASFILLATAAYIFIDIPTSNDPLITFHYSLEGDNQLRSGGNPDWNLAVEAFNNKNYAQAIRHIQEINPSLDVIEFYLGQSFFHLKDYKSAKENYQKILDRPGSSYREEAGWNHVVTSLLIDRNDEVANFRLDRIRVDSRNSFYEKAKELKEELKK